MDTYKINSENISIVSNFMANIKPDWWDTEGARQQLSEGKGWYCGKYTDKGALKVLQLNI